ncbi:uncharacterized protein I303_100352 [Kwoniella dejecticola CBS 10117]|uniref:Uncharacterized protein n=1 Tax=Kwoniella dejecticola CBS 10117 TaxID=1296121 RepID=A0A1A6AEP0_9TREE|nr:uncharacterized protein I303_00352 [Kwoniella dejecticola CBS 10117]OBR88535.1 hypothetical protein I303_00352 [Kwoniella dejecticola CBS 10117]
MSSYQHPFAARPSLTKRHTSPSPAILLSLPTLEALPPTPRSAKSYEPLNAFASSSTCSAQDHKPASGRLDNIQGHKSSKSLSSRMPLIKSRSKRPTSPKTEHYSFLPSIVSALDPRSTSTSAKRNDQNGKQHRAVSRSVPPQPSSPVARDFGVEPFLPFSNSTPPSTFSKGSLNALPSIQGVFDSYESSNERGIRRNRSGKGKNKRDTLKLPMMSPNPSEKNLPRNMHPFNEQEKDDNWQWNGLNQPAEVIINREPSQPHQSNTQQKSALRSETRKRNTSLTIDTHTYLNRPPGSREASSSSQSQRTPHSSLPAHSRSSLRSSLAESQAAEDKSTLTQWLGPEDDDPDDVELQALDVLETLSGHLLRDGFGYGFGASSGTGTVQPKSVHGVPSLTQSGHSTPSKTRSRSTTYSTQATSENDNKRYSQISDRDPPSIREWREQRKRSQSQTQQNRRFSEQEQIQSGRSMSISRRPPPPPPPAGPPPESLPPLPSQQGLTHRQIPANKNNKQAVYVAADDQELTGIIGTGAGAPAGDVNLIQENNKISVRSESGYIPDLHQIQIQKTASVSTQPPPPIPPRSASRLENRNPPPPRPHRTASSSQLRSRPQTPVQRKNSKEKQGVKVPLVFSSSSSPGITTRDDESDLVVVIDNRPPTPIRDMSSSTIPLHQRPLPPIPAMPDLATLPSSSTAQRSTFAQFAHPKLPSRLLRPKRPSTSPSTAPLASNTASPLSPERSKPLTRLVPREEPRRLSASSRAEGEEGRNGQMSALSFLALDDAAIQNIPRSGGRTSSFSGSTSNSGMGSTYVSRLGHSLGPGQVRTDSSSSGGLEGGYIMPPSERSKIGVDDRKALRRRRRGSQSSLSSVAGSEITSLLENAKLQSDADAGIEEVEEGAEEWTTAYEFGQSKARTREKELRLSLDIGMRPPIAVSLNSPLKSRPAPLNLFSFGEMGRSRNEYMDREYPKSAGLLPPPRPRRKISTSVPPPPSAQIPRQPTSPISPVSPNRRYGQISPRYTHRPIVSRNDIGMRPDISV